LKHRYLARKFWNHQPTALARVFERAASTKNLINLSLGDPDFHTDHRVIEGAMKDALEGWTHYTDSLGILELRQAIAGGYSAFGLHYEPDEILVTVGACHGTYLALEAILDAGDEIIVPSPHFTPYPGQIELAQGVPVFLPVREVNGFQVDPAELEKAVSNRTKAIILNTPNNPTGACYSRETIEKIGEVAIRHDILILADEVYGSLTYQDDFKPIASMPGLKNRTITLGSFSKDYTMTGWRIGYAAGFPELIQCMRDINEGICFSAPAVSQRAALHALKLKDELQAVLKEAYHNRMKAAYERIENIPGLSVMPPQGSFYLFVNISQTGLSSEEVMQRILDETGVLVLPGSAFGQAGEGYIRIACTVTKEVLEEAFDRIAAMSLFQKR
jgi:aspartate/methionine/tyrosine aminotransferase